MGVLLTFAGYGLVMYGLIRFARWARRRGIGGDLMSPFERSFHPVAHDARVEIRAEEERMVPMTSPDPDEKD